jgi:nitrogen fixation protein NifB
MTVTKIAHPCFDAEAKHKSARVHLPVAPKCNIQCNYCNRQYDCVNESRPGVTSAVLSPHQAAAYLKELHNHIENIAVIGIAGPGDPFANPEETLETMRLVKEMYPDKLFCLSTNGLNILPYIDQIAELGVSHVTVTINAVDPQIIAKIYSWYRFEKKVYRGIQGAELILKNQFRAIKELKKKGITVKINSIILPGINEDHIAEVAKKVSSLGADIMNCIPVVPNKDTVFETMQAPDKKTIFSTRFKAGEFMKLMTHCARCRADAAGLLGQDFKDAFGMLQEFAAQPIVPGQNRPYVAVATNEGLLVNQHLGEAQYLNIYKQTPNGYQFVEERVTPVVGSGDFRWIRLGNLLNDCRAILVSGIGPNPLNILQHSGVRVIQMTGLIDEGLEAIYDNKPIKSVKKTDSFKCGDTCRGNAQGCA